MSHYTFDPYCILSSSDCSLPKGFSYPGVQQMLQQRITEYKITNNKRQEKSNYNLLLHRNTKFKYKYTVQNLISIPRLDLFATRWYRAVGPCWPNAVFSGMFHKLQPPSASSAMLLSQTLPYSHVGAKMLHKDHLNSCLIFRHFCPIATLILRIYSL